MHHPIDVGRRIFFILVALLIPGGLIALAVALVAAAMGKRVPRFAQALRMRGTNRGDLGPALPT
jgi:hypothetical protein